MMIRKHAAGGSWRTGMVLLPLALAASPALAVIDSPPAMMTDASNAVLPTARINLGAAAQATVSGGVSSRPSSLGNWSAVGTACTGNLQGTVLASCFSITGAATLSQPTSGYVYTEEAYPFPNFLYNSSGWNNGTADNSGRTAAVGYRTRIFQHGQGDMVAYNCAGGGDSTRSGSTSFLANPAIVCFNGDLTAGVAGLYLNWGEALLDDGGFDAAAGGWVVNLKRSVSTGAKSAYWFGYRAQSIGSAAPDVAFGGSGAFNFAFDCAEMTVTPCLTLKADQRIYFNVTADSSGLGRYPTLNNNYYQYQSSLGGMNHVVGGTSVFQEYSDHNVSVVPLQAYFKSANKTANYTVQTAVDVGKHFNNASATGEVDFSLPAAAIGLNYCFSAQAAQTLKVIANGSDKIAIAGSNSAAGGNVTANALYASLCIEAHGTGQWITVATPDKTQWTVN